MTRKYYAGGAAIVSLTSALSETETAFFDVSAANGWPSQGPFVAAIGELASYEKILCERANERFNILQRGYDGTVAAAHDAGAAVTHVIDSELMNELSERVSLPTFDEAHPTAHTVQPADGSTLATEYPEGVVAAQPLAQTGLAAGAEASTILNVKSSTDNFQLAVSSDVLGVPTGIQIRRDNAGAWTEWVPAGSSGGTLLEPYAQNFEGVTGFLHSSLDGAYTVPAGKVLQITNIYSSNYYFIYVNGDPVFYGVEAFSSRDGGLGRRRHLYIPAGAEITFSAAVASFNIYGMLIDDSKFTYEVVNAATSYTVPAGKKLFVTHIYDTATTDVDGVVISAYSNHRHSTTYYNVITIDGVLLNPGQTITSEFIAGYLVDE